MPSALDPDGLTEEQRTEKVGHLFATAVFRLRSRPVIAASFSQNPPESNASPLELSPQTRLSVTTVSGFESPQRGERE